MGCLQIVQNIPYNYTTIFLSKQFNYKVSVPWNFKTFIMKQQTKRWKFLAFLH